MQRDRVGGRRGQAHAWAQWLSSGLVVALAVGFDLVADEPPVHVLGVALTSMLVGIVRLVTRAPFSGVTVALNAAVLSQPAMHALAKVAHLDTAPSGPGLEGSLPMSLSGILLHIATALLVIAVAASEPACALATSALTRALHDLRVLLCTPLAGPEPARPAYLVAQLLGSCRRLALAGVLTRRGPPAPHGLAV